MIKKLSYILIATLLGIGNFAHAAQQPTFAPSIIPITDATYYLGSTSPSNRWNGIYITGSDGCLQLTTGLINSTGSACGSGGGGGTFPFTSQYWGNSTSTVIGFTNGLLSLSSTTINGLKLSDLTQGFAFVGSKGIVQTVSTSTLTANLLATSSNTVWIDSSRTDSYTAIGTIAQPYKSISAANTAVTAASLPSVAYEISPGTYTEQSLTMPNIPTIVHSKGATLIVLSGASVGAGTITFPSDFTWYDGAIFGNVKATNSSLTNPHGFLGTLIAGNLTFSGLGTFVNGAILDQCKTSCSSTFPYPSGLFSQDASSTIITDVGALSNFLGNKLQSIIVNRGTMNLNDNDLNVATSTVYALTSTTTGSILHISGLSLENFGTGGAIDVRNSAPASAPNALQSIGVTEGAGSTNGIEMGTAVTFLADYNITTVAGVQLYGTPNYNGTSGVRPFNQAGLVVEGNSLLNFLAGATGVSTTTPYYGLTAASTTGVQLALSTGGGSSQWTLRNSYGTFYLATSTIAGISTSTISAFQIDTNGFPYFASLSGVGCAQFDASGKLTNTGTGCGSSSGLGSYDAWTHPVLSPYSLVSATTTALMSFGQASTSQLSAAIAHFNFFNATSTTATSTITNALQIGTTAGNNLLKITAPASSTVSVTTGGVVNITQPFDGAALVVTKAGSASDNGRMVVFNQTSTLDVQDMFLASSSCANCSTWNAKGFPTGKGVIKIEHTGGGVGFANSSLFSGDRTSCVDCQGIFLDTTLASSTGKAIQIKNKGINVFDFLSDAQLGIASSTPYAALSVKSFAPGTTTAAFWPYTGQTADVLQVGNTDNTLSVRTQAGGFGTTTLSGLNISASATTTSNVGILITNGCFADSGGCFTHAGGGTVTQITLGDNLFGTSPITTTGTIYGAVGTSATPTLGNLAFWNSAGDATHGAKLGTVGTSSATCSTNITCSAFTVVGGVSPTITGTGYPFTMASHWQQTTAGTTTALWLQGSPFSLFASSTSVFDNASTTLFTLIGASNGCAQFSNSGLLSSTGVACGSASGLSSYDAWSPHWSSPGYSATTSSIGIGTTTQRWALEVASSSAQIAISDAVDTDPITVLRSSGGGFYIATASPSTFATSTGSTAINIAPSGYVGINTGASAPAKMLTIGNGTGIQSSANGLAVVGSALQFILRDTSSSNQEGQWLWNSTAMQFNLVNQISGQTIQLSAGNTPGLVFDALSKDIGIGTSTFATASGRLTIASSTAPQLSLMGDVTDNKYNFRSIGGFLYIATSSSASVATSSNTALTIDNNGFLSVLAMKSSSGSNCVQVDTNGKLTNTGSACGAGGGLSSYNPFTNFSTTYSATTSNMLVGTTTGGLSSFTSASSTAPQFYLSSNGGNIDWTLRSTGGQFYLATTTLGGTSTSTVAALSLDTNGKLTLPFYTPAQVLYAGSNGIINGTATSSLTASAPLSLSQPIAVIGASASSLTCTNASAGVTGCLTGTDWSTFNNKLGSYDAWTHPSPSLYSATTSVMMIGTSTPTFSQLTVGSSTVPQLTITDDLNTNAWAFRDAGGSFFLSTSSPTTFATSSVSALSIDANGQFTLSFYPSAQLLYAGSNGKIGSVATGTVSAGSSAITVTAGRAAIGGALSIDCATSGSGQNGCLSSTDWTTFNNKLSSYNPFTNFSTTYSATTSNLLIATSTGGLGALQVSTSTAPQLVFSTGGGNNSWTFRNAGGLLYFATTSVAGTATSTVSAFSIDVNGFPIHPSMSSASGNNCVQVDTTGKLTSTGSACGAGGGLSSYNPFTNFSTTYSATTSNMLIATTTGGIGALTISTSTNQQIILSEGGKNGEWAFRNAGGDLFFSTTTVAGTATTSTAALTIKGTGKPGLSISSSTPFATLSVNPLTGDFSNQFIVGSSSATNFIINNSGFVGLGTTSPFGIFSINPNALGNIPEFVIGSSSATHLLVDGGGRVGVNDINPDFKLESVGTSINGYFGLTNSTDGDIFTVNTPGFVGIGTTTPWGQLSIASTTPDYYDPIFTIATGTGGVFNNLASVFATTTTLFGSVSGGDVGVRFSIGVATSSFASTQNLDQLYVGGRINSNWRYVACDVFQSSFTQLTTDTANICNQYAFIEDGNAVADFATSSGQTYLQLRTGATGVTSAVGDGFALQFPYAFLRNATNTPVMETSARLAGMGNASSTRFDIGFIDTAGTGGVFNVAPKDGCYFEASSTQANWQLITRNNNVTTQLNTGVASSSRNVGTAGFLLFRIELDSNRCTGYITATSTGSGSSANLGWTKSSITTNLPVTNFLTPTISAGNFTTAGLTKEIDVATIRLWFRGTDLYGY